MYEPNDYTTAGLFLWWRHLTQHQFAASSIIQTLLSGTMHELKQTDNIKCQLHMYQQRDAVVDAHTALKETR